MPLDYVLDDGKAKAGAAHASRTPGIDAVKSFGEARDMARLDPVADVAYGDPQHWPKRAVLRRRRNRDRRAAAPVFDGIADEVVQHLLHLVGIGDDTRQRIGKIEVEPAIVGFELARGSRCNAADHRAHIDTVARTHVLVALDPRQRQEIVDEPRHARGFVGHDVEEAQELLARRVLLPFPDFRAFVHEWVTPDHVRSWLHFVPQVEFVKNEHGTISLSFIGRYERLHEDYEYVRTRLGLGGPLAERNRTATITAVTTCKLLVLHKDDFENFMASHADLREAVGEFRLADAVPLDDLRPDLPLLPLERAIAHLSAKAWHDLLRGGLN